MSELKPIQMGRSPERCQRCNGHGPLNIWYGVYLCSACEQFLRQPVPRKEAHDE